MSVVPMFGAVVTFALILVLAAMLPSEFTGLALIALVLAAAFAAVVMYVMLASTLERARG